MTDVVETHELAALYIVFDEGGARAAHVERRTVKRVGDVVVHRGEVNGAMPVDLTGAPEIAGTLAAVVGEGLVAALAETDRLKNALSAAGLLQDEAEAEIARLTEELTAEQETHAATEAARVSLVAQVQTATARLAAAEAELDALKNPK